MRDLTGQRFGRLVVVGTADRPEDKKERSRWWTCKCDCGNEITTCGNYLKTGGKLSCGCYKRSGGWTWRRKNMALHHDVSCSEMLHMRNELHMANRDIAERLGCSQATVYAMIGKQPDGIRAKRQKKKDELPEVPTGKKFTELLAEVRPLVTDQPCTEPNVKKCDVVDELRLIFGAEAVKAYMSCLLYQMRVYPEQTMSADECMEALRTM